MRRLLVSLFVLIGLALSASPVHAAGIGPRVHHSLSAVPSLTRGSAVRPHADVAAPVGQVQSGAVTSAAQLHIPEGSIYASNYQVGSQALTPSQADDPNLTDIAYAHTVVSQTQFSYKNAGMLFGWGELGTLAVGDGTTYFLEFIASAYASPDAAASAYNSLTNYYATLPQPGTSGSNCTFSGADQCYEVTVPGAFVGTSSNLVYDMKARILLKSNSMIEEAFFMEHNDFLLNAADNENDLNKMLQAYVALFSSPQPSPSPSPSPTPKPSPSPTPSPSPQPLPSPKPAPVQFTIVKTQFEKPNNNPTTTDKALKKAKTGSKIMEVAYFLLSSGPSSVSVKASFVLKQGSKTVKTGTASGSVQPDPVNPSYAVFQFTAPKKAASYKGTITITAGSLIKSGSAKIKLAKK